MFVLHGIFNNSKKKAQHNLFEFYIRCQESNSLNQQQFKEQEALIITPQIMGSYIQLQNSKFICFHLQLPLNNEFTFN